MLIVVCGVALNCCSYDVAKRFSGKFAWISPVWLQLRANAAGGATITGTHDIDDGWMKDVRRACARAAVTTIVTAAAMDAADSLPVPETMENSATMRSNTHKPLPSSRVGALGPLGAESWPSKEHLPPRCPKIVPRIVWEAPQLSQTEMDKTPALIADFVERRGFDGVVLEMPVLSHTVPWISRFTQVMHAKLSPAGAPLAVIAVLPPAVRRDGSTARHGTPASVIADAVAAGVDRVSVMTYDFSSGRGLVGPNAPLHWVRSSARDVIEAAAAGVLRDAAFPTALLAQAEAAEAFVPRVREAVRVLREAGLAEAEVRADGSVGPDGGATSAKRGRELKQRSKQARRELARAVAASKVLVGMAMYGHHDPKANGVPEAITAGTYIDLLKTHKPRMLYDRGSAEHLFRYSPEGVPPGSRAVCYYPTLWSVAERLRLAASEGAGVALWEVGQGLDYWYDLM